MGEIVFVPTSNVHICDNLHTWNTIERAMLNVLECNNK